MFILTLLQGKMKMILISFIAVTAAFFGGLHVGKNYQKGVQVEANHKATVEIIKKNTDAQTVANKVDNTTIVYRDKVVTKYKRIDNDVVRYIEKESSASDVYYFPHEWVCLHNRSTRSEDTASSASCLSKPEVPASRIVR